MSRNRTIAHNTSTARVTAPLSEVTTHILLTNGTDTQTEGATQPSEVTTHILLTNGTHTQTEGATQPSEVITHILLTNGTDTQTEGATDRPAEDASSTVIPT